MSEKCRGKYCSNCETEYCEKSLDLFDEEIEFESEESLDGFCGVESWGIDDFGKVRDGRLFDSWEGKWRI